MRTRPQRRSTARGIRTLVRLFALLVLLLWSAQAAVHAATVLITDPCGQDCPEDDDRGCHCPPDCGCCARCAHAPPVIPPAPEALQLAFAPFVELPGAGVASTPASAEPGEILHVPKPPRA